jgi:CRISPR/Cas system-associated exonuclease Cas4 (RecB family)
MSRSALRNISRLIQTANNELPVEKAFVADLKRSIEITDSKNTRKPSQTYKPSSLKCIRNMYYQVTGAEQDKADVSATLIGICETGTDRHERVQNACKLMKENGIDCEYVNVADFVISRNLTDLEIVSQQGNETKLYHKKLNMSFLCDGIIRYKGHYYILEIKTESIYKWTSRTEVNPEHHNQGIAYSLSFGIDEVLFLYIARDTVDMKAFIFKVTDDMKQELVGTITNCDEYVKQLKVPPIPEDVSKKTCSYCAYKSRCKNE